MHVLPNDFAAQWAEIRDDALSAVDRVGRSGWLILGDEVASFEAEFAAWWGFDHAVGVASGLDAIEIALRCAGIGPGDRVLTTPLTAFATTLAIIRAGAEPVWCDVEASGGLDLELADAVLEADSGIRAFVPVHLFGHPLDPARLRDLVERHDVVLVEDCAQSAGASRDGAPTGRAGVAAAVSLYPTKNLGAMGDGGAILTDDEAFAQRARSLRNYGQTARYQHADVGLNSRLDEVHAAVLRSALLPRLDGWLARRAEIAGRFTSALAGSHVLRPVRETGGRSANHLYPVEVLEGEPGDIAAALSAAGIGVGRHYPVVVPDQDACRGMGVRATDFTVARRLAERELSLPIHPQLGPADVDTVLGALMEVAA